MKKLNKKGFTLAELLIVIAIIAILIAIAIPAFSASLRSAKLAVDHSNIRAMYAVYRTAQLTGSIDIGEDDSDTPAATDTKVYYLCKDGTIKDGTSAAPTDAYKTQVAAKAGECDNSLMCKENGSSGLHEEDKYITVSFTTGDWAFEFK